MSPDRDRVPAAAASLAVAALVAWSAWQRWAVLASSPFPLGIDGYFYPLQLRALLEHGALAYPSSPLAFYLLLPFAAATDPITGAKLGAAVLGALVAVPAYGLGARLGGSRGAGLVAAALATTSAGSMYVTFEFVKNGIGLSLALAAVWAALAALASPSRRRIAGALAMLVAAALTHKMAAALAAIAIAPAVAVAVTGAVGRGALRGRRLFYVAAGGGALGLGAIGLGLAAPHRFLSPIDAAPLRGLVTTHAAWRLPALAGHAVTLTMGHEAALGALAALAAASAWCRVTAVASARPLVAADRAAVLALAAVALVTALPWLDVADGQDLGFRLRVAAFAPLAVLAAAATRAIPARAWASPALAALAAAIVLAVPRAADRTDGMVVTQPWLASAAIALEGHVPAGATLVVPERHVELMAAYYTRAPVERSPDAVPRAQRVRLLTLAFVGYGSPLDRALLDARHEPALDPPVGFLARVPDGLVLVPEATWDWALTRLPARDRAHYAAWPTI